MTQVEKSSESKSLIEQLSETVQSVVNPPTTSAPVKINSCYNEHPSRRMKAAEWHGREDIRLIERPSPSITDDDDVIVRITNTTICGSDLHMYFNEVPGVDVLKKGDIMGHEAVGVIEEVGPNVKDRQVGQRVVISALIACGQCDYCKRQEFSHCDTTNPSSQMEKVYGHRTSGIFGYGRMTGGFAGLQTEYARIPFGSVNALVLPDSVSDEQGMSLSDILPTGWHGNELTNTQKGDTVVVWGCGPVGLCAQMCALARGASTVVAIDHVPSRLSQAKKLGSIPVNFEVDQDLYKIFDIIPGGPNCCIDCVGYRYTKSWIHWFQRRLKIESDSPEIINECIKVCKKGGRIALIGDYFATCNQLMIGAMMEKGLHISGGQLFCQKYWPKLVQLLQLGKLNPEIVYSHRFPFSEISQAYKIFSHQEDDCCKIVLKTEFGVEQEKKRGSAWPFGKHIQTE